MNDSVQLRERERERERERKRGGGVEIDPMTEYREKVRGGGITEGQGRPKS